jgi:hypothetical protein
MSGKTRWLGFIDVDEFFFPSAEDDLPAVLRDFEEWVAVSVNWVAFGSSGHEKAPDGYVIENFTERGELDHRLPMPRLRDTDYPDDHPLAYKPMNTHVKTILDPARVKSFRTAHHYSFLPGEVCVTENREVISSPVSNTMSIEKLRINHYWSKSLADIRRKVDKGRVASDSRKNPSKYSLDVALARDAAASGEVDPAATRFSQATRDTIAHYRSLATGEKPAAKPPRLRYRPDDWVQAVRRRLWRRIRKVIRLVKR